LQLIMGESTDLAQAGDTLIGDVQLSLADAVSTQIDPLKQRAESMIANVDSLLTRLQLILNDEARDDIDAGFNSIRRTLDALHRSAERVDELIVKESAAISATVENIKTVTDNLVAYNERIVSMLANMDTLSTSMAQADLDSLMLNIRTSSEHLRNITAGLERGDGTLGALLHNDTLYRNLESASRELDMLLEDLRLNPNRYMHLSVFGKKDRQPKLSKSDVQRIKDAIEDDVKQ